MQLLKLGYDVSPSASLTEKWPQAPRISAIFFFQFVTEGLLQKFMNEKEGVDDGVNERIISVYFRCNELTQAREGEEREEQVSHTVQQ